MSIEQALAENTAALHALTAVLAKLGIAPPAQLARPAQDAAPAAKAEKPKPAAKPAPAPAPAPAAATKPAPAALDYAPVGAAITAYAAANGREAAVAKLALLGVKSGKELKPDQYADALDLFCAAEVAA